MGLQRENRINRVMKTGVFLCTCSGTINIDFKKLKSRAGADVIEVHEILCQEPEKIKDVFERKKLSRALVACTSKKKVFEALDLDISFINLREHCGWVHHRKDATEKAKALINAALRSPPYCKKRILDVGREVFITGDPSAALRIAKHLMNQANVHVLISTPTDIVSKEDVNGITIYTGSLRSIDGRIGDFRIDIARNPIDIDRCISCGKCINACPKNAITPYPFYFIGEKCDLCEKCLDACPVFAIDFDENIKTIKAGQILVIGEGAGVAQVKKGIYVTNGKSAEETFKLALPAALELMSNIGSIEQEKRLTVSLDACAGGKSGLVGCRLCENACTHGAIARSGDAIVFDEVSCTGCGACAAVCPISLPKTDEGIYSRMERLLEGYQPTPKILMFACSGSTQLLDMVGARKIKYPAVLPMFVSSIEGVSEALILRAFDLGADGVVLLGCRECCNRSNEVSNFADIMLSEFGLGGRIKVILSSFCMDAFVKSVNDFSEKLTPSPLRSHEPVALKNASKRHVIMELIRGFSAKTGISSCRILEETPHPFANISISPSCTVCGACTAMCPTGALKREIGDIKFIYGYCIACGLCEKACPEKALSMHRVLDMARLIDVSLGSTIFTSEMLMCASCGKPYMTSAAKDRIISSYIENVRSDIKPKEQIELIRSHTELLKYCEKCRPAKAAAKMGLF